MNMIDSKMGMAGFGPKCSQSHSGFLNTVLTFASTLAAFSNGYSFSDKLATTDEETKESTGLTVNEESRIYGGTEVDIKKFPFAVNLRIDLFDEAFCGGALITPEWILTAGHCIRTDEYDITAVLGSNAREGESGEHIKVVEGFRHPLYNKKRHLYDVGLLRLAKKSKYETATICAADGSDNKVGTMATIVGWGKTEKGIQSDNLLGVDIEIISNAECNKQYRNRIKEGMMCAGHGGGKDSCNGDSGGPLVADGLLVGIASWGGKCGKHAGVYTRLTYVMGYINDILSGGTGSSFAETSSASGSSSLPEVGSPASGSSDASASTSTTASSSGSATTLGSSDESSTSSASISDSSEASASDASTTASVSSDSASSSGSSSDSATKPTKQKSTGGLAQVITTAPSLATKMSTATKTGTTTSS
ncbi:hypothetical protein BBJ29_003513 [Phytophthora kernoviae]|uniref:Peptidase S1 domain-containing protein n=1 Tax=Phytophthora kernoviae TaxID=325452 RepID=A0A3F2RLF3_9STRA|nr:hypothetical protein BBJ29_003513 [Phytophthora kernoviae]RLN59853.1 hypothetical protein BBP00_00006294 [Phytophthora kernoviae]